jgi:hypothetical protein
MPAGKAGQVPGAWRRQLMRSRRRGLCRPREGERQSQEKAQVQEELQAGNRFALESAGVEALYHYAAARVLSDYPGALPTWPGCWSAWASGRWPEAYQQFRGRSLSPLARKAQEAIREPDPGRQSSASGLAQRLRACGVRGLAAAGARSPASCRGADGPGLRLETKMTPPRACTPPRSPPVGPALVRGATPAFTRTLAAR